MTFDVDIHVKVAIQLLILEQEKRTDLTGVVSDILLSEYVFHGRRSGLFETVCVPCVEFLRKVLGQSAMKYQPIDALKACDAYAKMTLNEDEYGRYIQQIELAKSGLLATD